MSGRYSKDCPGPAEHETERVGVFVPVRHRKGGDLEILRQAGGTVGLENTEIQASLLHHQTPRAVTGQELCHARAAVAGGRIDRQGLPSEQRETQVVPDVSMGEEDAVERSPPGRPAAKRFPGNEVELAHEVRRRIDEPRAPGRLFGDAQGGHVARIEARPVTALGEAAGLRQAAVLDRSEHHGNPLAGAPNGPRRRSRGGEQARPDRPHESPARPRARGRRAGQCHHRCPDGPSG